MKKIIVGLVPTIIKRRGFISYIIETNIFNFLKTCFKSYDYRILNEIKHNDKLNLIISLGGNDLISLKRSKENLIRNKLNKYYLKLAIKKKIPFIGICHGAQFVANFFKSNIKKKKIILIKFIKLI